MKINFKKIISRLFILFMLIVALPSIKVSAQEHDIVLSRTSKNFFCAYFELQNNNQIKKVTGVLLNDKELNKVNDKSALNGSNYYLGDSDPHVCIKTVSKGDIIKIKTANEVMSFTINNPDSIFGNIHDANSIKYENATNTSNPGTVESNPDSKNAKFTPKGNPPLEDFRIEIEPATLAKEISAVKVGSRDYNEGSKVFTWQPGTYNITGSSLYIAQPSDNETIILTFKDGNKIALKYKKSEKALVLLDKIPGNKILKVRLRGKFESAMVDQIGYDAVSSASIAVTANENSDVKLEAVEVIEGTADSDIKESDWKPLYEMKNIDYDGDKSYIEIPKNSGMEARYSYLSGKVTLNGIPKTAGKYEVIAHVFDRSGRKADSNPLYFTVYGIEDTYLENQLSVENSRKMQDGKYIWDMEPWIIKKFDTNDETVTVPKDIKAWYGSHQSGTYGELGRTTKGEPTQTLIIDKDTNLTFVNMKILSDVKIIVKQGAKLNLLDSVVFGKIIVEEGGTFSMNYDTMKKQFITGSSIVGQIEVKKGAILENAYIYSHANYLSDKDNDNNSSTSEPVVRILGNTTIIGEVHVKGEDGDKATNGQTGLSIENGATVTVPQGSILAGYGGGESALTSNGGTAILMKDGAKIVGSGKLIAVGGSGFNVGQGAVAKGGTGVDGNGTVDIKEAYIQGGNTNTSTNDIGKPYTENINISNNVIGVANNGKHIPVPMNYPKDEQPAYWRYTIYAPPTEMAITGSEFINPKIESKKIDVDVKIVWEGISKEEKTPEVTIKLLSNDKETGNILLLNSGNAYKDTFKDLNKYESDGKTEIKYYIKELDIKDYASTITGNMNDGFIITNTKKQLDSEITSKTNTKKSYPKTGVDSPVSLYATLLIISGVLFFLTKKSTKKNNI